MKLPAEKYDAVEELARGGMGVVYKAVQRPLSRLVAVKMIYPHFAADPGFAKRFRREAQMMAKLSHEGIVRIYDVEEGGEAPYLVMEYVEGMDLRKRVQDRGRLSWQEAVDVARQVAEALAYAHGRGVIHRDIKPANIMLGREGQVKVGDFGIASAVGEATLTTASHALGTPEYMAPEQATGGPVDGRVDLYALGLLLHAMLSGASPLRGVPASTILSRLAAPEEVPLALPPDTPEPLVALVRRLTRKDPADRPNTAREVAEALAALQQSSRQQGRVVGGFTADLRGGETQMRRGVRPLALHLRRGSRLVTFLLACLAVTILLLARARRWPTSQPSMSISWSLRPDWP